MLLSAKCRYGGIAVLLVCTLEILSTFGMQHDTNIKKSQLDVFQIKNTTISNQDPYTVNSTHKVSTNGVLSGSNVTTVQETDGTKRLRKLKRRKFRRRQHKVATTTTESSLMQQIRNQTRTNSNTKKKRKRKLRRRKNRKGKRRPQKQESNNILDITTAKSIIFPNIKNSNSTINEIIRKLNENPEDNFEEFRALHANLSSSNGTAGKNVANLVAPVPMNAEFTTALHDNITLHISIGNTSNYIVPIKRNNRCRKKKGGCTHFCNPKGKIKCSCLKGFALAPDQKTCLDIDECKTSNGGCEKECHNTLGSYNCRCPRGLRLEDDLKSCSDINECLLRNGHGPCQDTCENTFGSYKCSCDGLNGTLLGNDGHTCEDINECLLDNGGCSHNCINTLGRVFCSCPDGMELSSDWKTCQDVNECEDEAVRENCSECVNTEGSYRCMDTEGYQSDESSEIVTCKPLPLPQVGFLSCSRDGAKKFYAKTGRERVTNSPGTICKLICPVGYKMVGNFYVSCGVWGKWEGKTEAQCIRVEPPTLLCPPNQIFLVNRSSKRTKVEWPPPRTNINWKYVKSFPSWGKELSRSLRRGRYDMNFIAQDPNSKLSVSCTFKIIVEN